MAKKEIRFNDEWEMSKLDRLLGEVELIQMWGRISRNTKRRARERVKQ